MPPGIFLVGPMASGKTVVGRAVAGLLEARFVDTDELVIQGAGPISGIFAQHGEAGFRRLESAALAAAAEQAGAAPTPTVVATGGGAVLDPANRALLSGHFTVYLLTDPETVAPRVRTATGRPLLDAGDDALQRWSEIFAVREPLYRDCAQLTIDTRGATPAELAETIADAYRRRTDPARRDPR
ncbi:shikimate kinase [Zafaria cholistanensis]|uniref:Shikimate kinase n=1 Tax=Zafaria cholistanensis TaxID=1682741 RepID=A0A5A7NNI8_9MICC|nr:shikimate kinase [Zafaria cholistanensis]GER22179.1 shikimate kinase [Zafaria cholistanensis]